MWTETFLGLQSQSYFQNNNTLFALFTFILSKAHHEWSFMMHDFTTDYFQKYQIMSFLATYSYFLYIKLCKCSSRKKYLC